MRSFVLAARAPGHRARTDTSRARLTGSMSCHGAAVSHDGWVHSPVGDCESHQRNESNHTPFEQWNTHSDLVMFVDSFWFPFYDDILYRLPNQI